MLAGGACTRGLVVRFRRQARGEERLPRLPPDSASTSSDVSFSSGFMPAASPASCSSASSLESPPNAGTPTGGPLPRLERPTWRAGGMDHRLGATNSAATAAPLKSASTASASDSVSTFTSASTSASALAADSTSSRIAGGESSESSGQVGAGRAMERAASVSGGEASWSIRDASTATARARKSSSVASVSAVVAAGVGVSRPSSCRSPRDM